jgi:hypothetical protein
MRHLLWSKNYTSLKQNSFFFAWKRRWTLEQRTYRKTEIKIQSNPSRPLLYWRWTRWVDGVWRRCFLFEDLESEAVPLLARSCWRAAPKSLHLGPPTSSRFSASSSRPSTPNSRSAEYSDLERERGAHPLTSGSTVNRLEIASSLV